MNHFFRDIDQVTFISEDDIMNKSNKKGKHPGDEYSDTVVSEVRGVGEH